MAKALKSSAVVQAALSGQAEQSVSQLVAELLRAFGGAAKLSHAVKDEFDSAPSGGMARQRILEGVMRLVAQASNQSKDNQSADQLSESELEEQLTLFLKQRRLVIPEAAPDGVNTAAA